MLSGTRHAAAKVNTAAGEIKDRDNDMRSILLHFETATTRIDGFTCSDCDWFHPFTSAEADGTLPRQEVDLAHARFAEHKCAEYPKTPVRKPLPYPFKGLRR
jgi:hypothetical protein